MEALRLRERGLPLQDLPELHDVRPGQWRVPLLPDGDELPLHPRSKGLPLPGMRGARRVRDDLFGVLHEGEREGSAMGDESCEDSTITGGFRKAGFTGQKIVLNRQMRGYLPSIHEKTYLKFKSGSAY